MLQNAVRDCRWAEDGLKQIRAVTGGQLEAISESSPNHSRAQRPRSGSTNLRVDEGNLVARRANPNTAGEPHSLAAEQPQDRFNAGRKQLSGATFALRWATAASRSDTHRPK